MQLWGVRLLDSHDLGQQPLEWFSDPRQQPLSLPIRLLPPYRYLDITELAQRQGWQVQVEGQRLKITTPLAQVESLRRGNQAAGDRLVLNLNRPAPWQVSQQGQSLMLTVDAQTAPELAQQLQHRPGQVPVQIQTGSNQTTLQMMIPATWRPRIWTLPHPNRLIIDLQPENPITRDLLWAPGLRWRQQLLSLGASRFPVVWLVVNPRQPGLSLRPIWGDPATLVGINPLSAVAGRSQASAAINGGFFNRNRQLPLGAIRQEGRWISSPILNRGAIAWDEKGRVKMGRLSLQETLITANGQRLSLQSLNSGYVQAGIARYTQAWGTTYTPLTDNELIVTVQADRVIAQRPLGKAGEATLPIPVNGYLLSLRSNRSAASAVAIGTALSLERTLTPDDFDTYPQILAAGPLLLQNRQIVLDAKQEQFSDAFIRETASRSAIATTSEGNLLIVAVHDRVGGEGPTLGEMAQLLQQMGALEALNLDGGSSTTLYLGGQLLDRSSRSAARVHNGIGIFLQPSPEPIRP
ncbi:phosphodiester glycosidase family protein [Neosynechococcus sphagnicola]|uniref:phosphodiester glycosidase family protein n=1 Tax=Neosynechococcus sphagnicola TaxID=1501145 RepID=UPI00068ACCEC|nr:phosphodiester glycosidase family protein [Neosynechococcus sphagnicola]